MLINSCFTFCNIACLFLVYNLAATADQNANAKKNSEAKILLDLPNCKIPDVPLDNAAISEEWNVEYKEVNCLKEPDISTLSDDGELSLTDYATSTFETCCYTEILRPEELYSDNYELSNCKPFPSTNSVSIPETDYVFVTCTNQSLSNQHGKDLNKQKSSASLLKKFHAQLRLKSSLTPKLKYWEKFEPNKEKPVSILILMLDSISRTHALRGIPETMKYMTKQMNFIDYKGYHVLGEPTIENYVPMMLGTVTSDWEMNSRAHYAGKFDDLPFIWKNFSHSNYVTMNNEDFPLWHTFNFNGRLGFTKQQFDFNLRPYYLAQEYLNEKQSKKTVFMPEVRSSSGFPLRGSFLHKPLLCIESQPIYKFLFGRAWKFLNVISPKVTPSFTIHFLGWPQHDHLVGIRVLDNTMLELMKNIRKTPEIYDNTVIAFLGDHGFRWADYSGTPEGLLERDLVLFQMRLPERFQQKYPEFAANLKVNAERVTSHLDFFKTLAHIHKIGVKETVDAGDYAKSDKDESYGYNREYGISLFHNISIQRTCEEAQIPERFCSCNYPLHSSIFNVNKFQK